MMPPNLAVGTPSLMMPDSLAVGVPSSLTPSNLAVGTPSPTALSPSTLTLEEQCGEHT